MEDVKFPFQDIIDLINKAFIAHQKFEERKNASGENFNIFSVLGLEYKEILHSRFIAELLNPHGKHSKKSLFLQKFLEKADIPYDSVSSLEQASVCVEDNIGFISNDHLQGGQIDIIIKIPPKQIVVIENKINAGDQKYQLVRYKNAYPSAYIIYLTKEGKSPSMISTHVEKNGIQNKFVDFPEDIKIKKSSCNLHIKLSYKEDILLWLEECYQEVTRLPLLRDNIYQYINTVKQLTMQITDNEMANELAEEITASEISLQGYFLLRKDDKIIKAVESNLLLRFIQQVRAKIEQEKIALIWNPENNEVALGHVEGESVIQFYTSNPHFGVSFGFDKWRQHFFVSIFPADNKSKDNNVEEVLVKKLKNLGTHTSLDKFYYVLYFGNSLNLNDQNLHEWREADIKIWKRVAQGGVANSVVEYFKIFITALQEANQLPVV